MKLPIFEELGAAKKVLIVGAGGGFDVYCGLPLYFWLKQAGKEVHLANLSFSELGFFEGERPVPEILRVTPASGGAGRYFPEVHLATWLSERYGETPVYAIERAGAQPVLAAYEWLVRTLQPDTLVLVDGRTDSLMRGDESDLGTPQEDMASLYAANAVRGPERKLLICLGFGIDTFHGVFHAQFLENAAALIQSGGYVGAWSLMREMKEFQLYREALEYVSTQMSRHVSIVNTSIVSAVRGRFGNIHTTHRTEGSELFINPLMGLYWAFRLEAVAQQNLYLDQIAGTRSYTSLTLAIEKFRAGLAKTREWKEIPC